MCSFKLCNKMLPICVGLINDCAGTDILQWSVMIIQRSMCAKSVPPENKKQRSERDPSRRQPAGWEMGRLNSVMDAHLLRIMNINRMESSHLSSVSSKTWKYTYGFVNEQLIRTNYESLRRCYPICKVIYVPLLAQSTAFPNLWIIC